MAKLAMAATFGGLAAKVGANGRFTGHACRIAGAVRLASHGVSIDRIMFFARWRSNAVLRYIRDGPQAVCSQLALDASPQRKKQANPPLAGLTDLTKKLGSLFERLACKVEKKRPRKRKRAQRVLNPKTGILHVTCSRQLTRCGWRWDAMGIEPPVGEKWVECRRCLTSMREKAFAAAGVDLACGPRKGGAPAAEPSG